MAAVAAKREAEEAAKAGARIKARQEAEQAAAGTSLFSYFFINHISFETIYLAYLI